MSSDKSPKKSALTASMAPDASESEDSCVFEDDSPEFIALTKLFATWTAEKKIGAISNREHGEAVTRAFTEFVAKEHAELARRVERDSSIYEVVVMEFHEAIEEESE